jgi:hypothetical protein
LPDDGQSGPKHVARALTFKLYVLISETRLNKVVVRTKVNVTVGNILIHSLYVVSFTLSTFSDDKLFLKFNAVS